MLLPVWAVYIQKGVQQCASGSIDQTASWVVPPWTGATAAACQLASAHTGQLASRPQPCPAIPSQLLCPACLLWVRPRSVDHRLTIPASCCWCPWACLSDADRGAHACRSAVQGELSSKKVPALVCEERRGGCRPDQARNQGAYSEGKPEQDSSYSASGVGVRGHAGRHRAEVRGSFWLSIARTESLWAEL